MLSKASPRLWSFLALMMVLILAGCSQVETGAGLSDMPADVLDAPVTVQQAYQFAVANPDMLKQIPCYCGCGAMGHTSNYACYVAGQSEDGSIKFDNHALGCSICVDITLDTMRLMSAGKPVSEIRTYIDTTYAQYGPSNIP